MPTNELLRDPPTPAVHNAAAPVTMRAVVTALLAVTLVASACGGGLIIVSVNTGTVAADPFCRDGTGSFDLREQGGLLLLVVINSNTLIVAANGGAGTCTDLSAGAVVQVRGTQHGTTITAQSVRVQ
jgi:hypothetical protein